MQSNRSDCWRIICASRNRPFLFLPEREFSYADLHHAILRWIHLFDELGLADGDRIIIRTAADFAGISCFLAAFLDGKVPVNLAPDTSDDRLLSLARTTEAQCIVHDGLHRPTGAAGLPSQYVVSTDAIPAPRGFLAKLRSRDALAGLGIPPSRADRMPYLPVDGDRLAYLLFTSGTTSAPIGVRLTSENVFANLATISRLFDYNAHSRIFNDMPLSHADGLVQGPLLAMVNGCSFIRAGGFAVHRLEAWLEQLRSRRATHFITVPTIWMMIDAHAAHNDYFDAPELVSLQSVAAKLPEEVWKRLEARFGHPLANHYGLTETVTSALYAGPHPEMGPHGTIGKPVDCEARIDPAANGEGELQLRGPNVVPGYWHNAERDAESFTDDGWFRTGDLACRNSDGSYSILGRLKNVIMTGGILIRPDEIDEVMLTHPDVSESVTLAYADEIFGEIPVTVIVARVDAQQRDLFAHARANLEERKVPRHITLVPEIPRGISGKPRLAELRESLIIGHSHQNQQNGEGADIEASVRSLAAEVFSISEEELSLRAGPDDMAEWDSFSHLNLILEIERHFSIRIPASRIASIQSLDDLCRTVRELV